MTTAAVIAAQNATILGSASGGGLEDEVNAQLATLLSHTIMNVQLGAARGAGTQNHFQVVVTYQTGAATIATPFVLKLFTAKTLAAAGALVDAFMAAHTTYFFSPVSFSVPDDQPRAAAPCVLGLLYNTVYADGLSHFGIGGSGGGGGGGTVTSVGLTAPAQFSVTGSPVTGAGALALAWVNEAANIVLAGPAAGGAAAPTFRALAAADIPNLDAAKITAGQLATARGGTGVDGSAAANGNLLIGNGTGYSLAALTAGANITITPGAGSISIAAAGGGGGLTDIVGITYAPADVGAYPLASSRTDVDVTAFSFPVTVPASGRLLVTIGVWITISDGTTSLGFRVGGTPLAYQQIANAPGGPTDEMRYLTIMLTGLTPGAATLVLQGANNGETPAEVKAWVNFPTTFIAIPC